MKFLLDENLSPKLVRYLTDFFPASCHVRDVQLAARNDSAIWQWARIEDYAILTQDDDFVLLAALRGHPPKIVCLRFGNRGVREIAAQIQRQSDLIIRFLHSEETACLELLWGPFVN